MDNTPLEFIDFASLDFSGLDYIDFSALTEVHGEMTPYHLAAHLNQDFDFNFDSMINEFNSPPLTMPVNNYNGIMCPNEEPIGEFIGQFQQPPPPQQLNYYENMFLEQMWMQTSQATNVGVYTPFDPQPVYKTDEIKSEEIKAEEIKDEIKKEDENPATKVKRKYNRRKVAPNKSKIMTRLEEKKQRNRDAAAKCRKKKMSTLNSLEENIKELGREVFELQAERDQMKDSLKSMKLRVQKHRKFGCFF